MSGSPSSTVEVRRARADQDEAEVLRLTSEYPVWALAQLEEEYSIVDMPVDPSPAPGWLDAYRPPLGLHAVAELNGQIAGIGAVQVVGRTAVGREPGMAGNGLSRL